MSTTLSKNSVTSFIPAPNSTPACIAKGKAMHRYWRDQDFQNAVRAAVLVTQQAQLDHGMPMWDNDALTTGIAITLDSVIPS